MTVGGWVPFPQLIEIARTLHREQAHTAASSGIKGRKVMLTIAIAVSWLSVVVIYLMAGTDRRKRCY